MVPVKLLLDEDSTVRSAASKFVNKMQVYLSENFEANDLLIRMEILNWPICSLVPLKAQECLLDSYINLSQKENCLDIVVNMLPAALSSFSDVANSDSYAGDEV